MSSDITSKPCIFALPASWEPLSIDARISRVGADVARQSTAFVFRLSEVTRDASGKQARVIAALSGAAARPDRETALTRASGKPIFVIDYSENLKEHRVQRVNVEGLTTEAASDHLPEIRQADLLNVIAEREELCWIQASTGFHFLTPSQKHTTQFLRVGDALQSIDSLDCLAFWLLPLVAEADAILLDTSSIASVALRALQLLSKSIPLDWVYGHPRHDRRAADDSLKRLLSICGHSPRILCIVSVTSSGSFCDAIEEIRTDAGNRLGSMKMVALYALGSNASKIETLCQLPYEVVNYAVPNDCPNCKLGDALIPVDPRVYYVRQGKDIEVALDADYFRDGREFVERYRGVSGVFRVHRDDPNDSRHHAFDVDVSVLLNHKAFMDKYVETLRQIPNPPDVIVTPNHEVGQRMGRVAEEVLRSQLLVHNDLRSVGSEDARQLSDARRIMVVDDVLNTGSRLEKFNASLRECFSPFDSVFFLVGIARPESMKDWSSNETALTKKHDWTARLAYLDRIFLPAWCPWCDEYDLLAKISRAFAAAPEWLKTRAAALVKPNVNGISDEPLTLLPGVQSRTLGDGSPVGPRGLSSMGTLFSVTAALQGLRNCEERSKQLGRHFPVANVLGLETLTRYSEGLLRACLLRLVRPSEWNQSVDSLKVSEQLKSWALQPGQDIILGEMLLAIGRGAVLHFGPSDITEIYDQPLGNEVVSRIIRILRLR